MVGEKLNSSKDERRIMTTMTGATDNPNRAGTVWRDAELCRLLVGSMVSLIGDAFFGIALPWIVLQMSGSAMVLGEVLLCYSLPRIGLLLVGGVFSDKMSPRKILIVVSAVQACSMFCIGELYRNHFLTTVILSIFAMVFGMAESFATPALKVLILQEAGSDRIHAVNATFQTATQVCALAGASVAGIIISRWSMFGTLMLDAASFIVFMAALFAGRRGENNRAKKGNMLRSIGEGFEVVWHRPECLKLIVVLALINLAVTGATQVGLPLLAKIEFGSATAFGFIVAFAGLGGTVGAMAAGFVGKKWSIRSVVIGCCLCLGILVGALAWQGGGVWVSLAVALLGGVAAYANVRLITWFQISSDPALIGRIMSIVVLCSTAIAPASLAVWGWLARSHMQTMFLAAGALLLCGAIAGTLLKRETNTT